MYWMLEKDGIGMVAFWCDFHAMRHEVHAMLGRLPNGTVGRCFHCHAPASLRVSYTSSVEPNQSGFLCDQHAREAGVLW